MDQLQNKEYGGDTVRWLEIIELRRAGNGEEMLDELLYLRTFTIFDKDGKNIIAGLYNLSWKEKAMLWLRSKVYSRGHLMDPVFRTKYLQNMLKYGYAVIVVERPGTGASFGVMDASFEVAAKNASEILDWIASQTWCNGNIGMFGDSFQAMIQFATAAAGNPHLKAIFPASSSLDNYSAVIYRAGSKGGRIRITIAFADADNFETPVLNPEPRLRLLRDTDHRSSIQLPVVRPQ
jgi:hypothetical protein